MLEIKGLDMTMVEVRGGGGEAALIEVCARRGSAKRDGETRVRGRRSPASIEATASLRASGPT